MSAARLRLIPTLARPMFERRFVGEDGDEGSAVPGAFFALSLSLLASSIVLPERGARTLVGLLAAVALFWSFVSTFLGERELEAGERDRRVLETLPVAPWQRAAARSLVLLALLGLDTLNLALPPAALLLVVSGPGRAVAALAAAACAVLCGLVAALLVRRALAGLLGRRLEAFEGPLRLLLLVVLFTLVLADGDPSRWAEALPALEHLPPLSFAAFADGRIGPGVAAVLIAGLAAPVALAGGPAAGDARESRRGGDEVPAAFRRFVRSEESASFLFARAQIRRDRTFRARLWPLFAFPFAVVALLALRPDEPTLAHLALHGAVVYLAVAQSLLLQSESAEGPALLETLPLRVSGAWRTGQEKAFLLGVWVPAYALLGASVVLAAALGRGPEPGEAARHALLAAGNGALVTVLLFGRIRRPFFSVPDSGRLEDDPTGPAMVALLLAAVLGTVSMRAAQDAVGTVALLLADAVGCGIVMRLRRRADQSSPR